MVRAATAQPDIGLLVVNTLNRYLLGWRCVRESCPCWCKSGPYWCDPGSGSRRKINADPCGSRSTALRTRDLCFKSFFALAIRPPISVLTIFIVVHLCASWHGCVLVGMWLTPTLLCAVRPSLPSALYLAYRSRQRQRYIQVGMTFILSKSKSHLNKDH